MPSLGSMHKYDLFLNNDIFLTFGLYVAPVLLLLGTLAGTVFFVRVKERCVSLRVFFLSFVLLLVLLLSGVVAGIFGPNVITWEMDRVFWDYAGGHLLLAALLAVAGGVESWLRKSSKKVKWLAALAMIMVFSYYSWLVVISWVSAV